MKRPSNFSLRILELAYFDKNPIVLAYLKFRKILHYYALKFRRLMGYKTFHVDLSKIDTRDGCITINEEYQLRDGGLLERAIVKDVRFKKFFIKVTLHLMEIDRTINVEHTMVKDSGSSSWRILTKDSYDVDKWKMDKAAYERGELDDLEMERNWEVYPP